jgi:NAD+ diphosphatase
MTAMDRRPVFSLSPLSARYPEPELQPEKMGRWVVVQGNFVLVSKGDPPTVILTHYPESAGIDRHGIQYLGMAGTVPYYAAELPAEVPVPEGYCLTRARELYGRLPDEEVALAAYALRIIDYDRSTRFCGRCGKKTRALRTERAKLCTDCNRIVYPRLSPAIIVLIRKGDQILLARSPRFPAGMYSVIAGFVEPGECLEETIHREVSEEVGVEVKNIRYFGSEPWPFPDSLMIGFVADHTGGEIAIDNKEIEDAGWFGCDTLPPLPSPMSISRALIEAWRRNEL